MSISLSVEKLAAALSAHVRALSPPDPILVGFLSEVGTMPLWRDLGRLDQWDERVQRYDIDRDTRERAADRASQLAEEIVELGIRNLYGAIQKEQTAASFSRVAGLLRQFVVADLPDAEEFDFGVWYRAQVLRELR